MNKSWILQSTGCEEGTVDASKTLDSCEELNPFCWVVILGDENNENAQDFGICMRNVVTE